MNKRDAVSLVGRNRLFLFFFEELFLEACPEHFPKGSSKKKNTQFLTCHFADL